MNVNIIVDSLIDVYKISLNESNHNNSKSGLLFIFIINDNIQKTQDCHKNFKEK